MKKLVIVDADHTIRKPSSGGTFAKDPYDQHPINKFIYKDNPNAVFVAVSNQGGVEAGYKTLDDAINEGLFTLQTQPQLALYTFIPDFAGTQLWYCWSGDDFIYSQVDHNGGFRKPDCKALLSLIDEFSVSKEDTVMYGDRDEDKLAAEKAGIDFIQV